MKLCRATAVARLVGMTTYCKEATGQTPEGTATGLIPGVPGGRLPEVLPQVCGWEPVWGSQETEAHG